MLGGDPMPVRMRLGRHVIAEFVGCDPKVLNDVSTIREIMIKAAEAAGARMVNDFFHKFNPHGVTGVVVVQESHLTIHTWPEYGYAAVDIFTCGRTNPWKAFEYIKEYLKPRKVHVEEIERGLV